MTGEEAVRLQDVFDYMQDLVRQCRRMIRDATYDRQKETGCYFTHRREWDYAVKPGDHFLDTTQQFALSRAWMTFVPEGDISVAALFYFQFFHPRHPVVPALMYGSLDPGPGSGLNEMDRWASYSAINAAEQGEEGLTIEQDGPLAVIRSSKANRFAEARLVRVPLESIDSPEALHRIVTRPLAALVGGRFDEGRELLKGVSTQKWPAHLTHADEDEDEDEQEQV